MVAVPIYKAIVEIQVAVPFKTLSCDITVRVAFFGRVGELSRFLTRRGMLNQGDVINVADLVDGLKYGLADGQNAHIQQVRQNRYGHLGCTRCLGKVPKFLHGSFIRQPMTLVIRTCDRGGLDACLNHPPQRRLQML